MASVFRFFSSAIDLHSLLPGFEPRENPHVALRHPVVGSEKVDQRRVGLAVDGARGEAHLDALAVAPCEFRTGSSGLHMQIENHRDATAGRMCQRTISTT